tara:strand:+ start:5603 stop:5797 length:195 start_codon:yes stop_codon:yes gene_type:complete
MKITELSIADLKAAYDFNREYIQEIIETSTKNKVGYEHTETYRESLKLGDNLYHALLNKITKIN